jgi:DNA-binding MarR family transcriptional regulator
MKDPETDFEERARRLLEGIRALVRRFSLAERADISCCGMTVAQATTLEALEDSSLRLSELGQRLGITPSTLTRNLARLEERGLVIRETDPVDGRAQRVLLSPAGRTAADGVRRQEEAFAGSVLNHLPTETVTDTLTALDQLLTAIRAATENCCPGAYDHLMTEIIPSPTHGAKHE